VRKKKLLLQVLALVHRIRSIGESVNVTQFHVITLKSFINVLTVLRINCSCQKAHTRSRV